MGDGPENSVHIVDDDVVLCRMLSTTLRDRGFEVSAYSAAEDFLANPPRDASACLLLDVRLPKMSGLALMERLKAQGWIGPVLVTSGHGDIPMAVEAMKAGAFDYIPKPFGIQDVVERIKHALARSAADRVAAMRESRSKAALSGLTPRQRDVLNGIVDGKLTKVIAHELGLSPRTVESYRADIMTRTRAQSSSELVRMAVLAGY